MSSIEVEVRAGKKSFWKLRTGIIQGLALTWREVGGYVVVVVVLGGRIERGWQ